MIVKKRYGRETGREYALRVLKENIVMLELEPGSRISENELASEIGVSRTPIREALIELSKSKIVKIYPQKGSYVSLIDWELVEEALFMRLTLEKAVVRLACQGIEEEKIQELEKNVKLQKFYIDNNEAGELLELDNQFHKELFAITNKIHIYRLMSVMMLHFDPPGAYHAEVPSNLVSVAPPTIVEATTSSSFSALNKVLTGMPL